MKVEEEEPNPKNDSDLKYKSGREYGWLSPEIKQANKLAKGASEMLINKEIPFSAILKRYKP